MSLEQFLKPDGYYFNFIHASELISHACYLVSIVEKDKETNRGLYTKLYTFLDNKQKYIEMKNELELLIDKYNLHDRLNIQCSDGEEEFSDAEDDDDYNTLTHQKNLELADKLLARDITWSKTYYSFLT